MQAGAGSHRHGQAELAAEPTQGIDALHARRHPLGPCSVQRLQCLLLDGLDANLTDLGVAIGAQQRHAIGRVRLVSKAEALHVRRGQQPHRHPLALQAAAPVVRRPTSFHDDSLTLRLTALNRPRLA